MIDAAMAQLVEHILGKDEVPGPNPGSSSRQPRRETFGALVFYGAPTRHLWEHFSLWVVWSCYPILWIGLCAKGAESVRIPRAKFCKLACKAKREGIFAESEYPVSSRHSRCGSVLRLIKILAIFATSIYFFFYKTY